MVDVGVSRFGEREYLNWFCHICLSSSTFILIIWWKITPGGKLKEVEKAMFQISRVFESRLSLFLISRLTFPSWFRYFSKCFRRNAFSATSYKNKRQFFMLKSRSYKTILFEASKLTFSYRCSTFFFCSIKPVFSCVNWKQTANIKMSEIIQMRDRSTLYFRNK